MLPLRALRSFFFFNDTATTEIYTLSLHDALPISGGDVPAVGAQRERGDEPGGQRERLVAGRRAVQDPPAGQRGGADRESTRLNSRHAQISYAVFFLKKKKKDGARVAAMCGDDFVP